MNKHEMKKYAPKFTRRLEAYFAGMKALSNNKVAQEELKKAWRESNAGNKVRSNHLADADKPIAE